MMETELMSDLLERRGRGGEEMTSTFDSPSVQMRMRCKPKIFRQKLFKPSGANVQAISELIDRQGLGEWPGIQSPEDFMQPLIRRGLPWSGVDTQLVQSFNVYCEPRTKSRFVVTPACKTWHGGGGRFTVSNGATGTMNRAVKATRGCLQEAHL